MEEFLLKMELKLLGTRPPQKFVESVFRLLGSADGSKACSYCL
jgi:hypothetical protein